MDEENLAKPDPQKETSSSTEPEVVHSENPGRKFHILKYFLLGIFSVVVLLVIGGGAFFLGRNTNLGGSGSKPSPTPQENLVACTQDAKLCPDGVTYVSRQGPNCEFSPCPSDVESQTYLEIPEYGVKIPLTQNISDAYYLPETASKGFIYLKVRSLDSEPQCKSDASSTAGIAKQDIKGPFSFDLNYQEFKQRFPGVEIGNYYYYIDLAQYSCAESSTGQNLLNKVRKEFSEASKNIEKIN